jgi:hypothetical protein
VLRQLVEFQLAHSADIKKSIDAAWGVGRNTHRKKDPNTPAAASEDGPRLEDLQLLPIGQDLKRRRYWVVDGEFIALEHAAALLAMFVPVVFFLRNSQRVVSGLPLMKTCLPPFRLTEALLFDEPMENNRYLHRHLLE